MLFWELYVFLVMLVFYSLINCCKLRRNFKKKLDGESKIAKKITELKKKRREAREKYNDFADDDSNDNEANKDKALK